MSVTGPGRRWQRGVGLRSPTPLRGREGGVLVPARPRLGRHEPIPLWSSMVNS